jgi:uncharacterized repeat protein (TIGR03803 family)
MRTSKPRYVRALLGVAAIMTFITLATHGRAFAATESVLHSFTGAPGDGYGPHDLVKDGSGNLYGTTLSGGTNNRGSVFEMTPIGSGWFESIIWDFGGGTDGSQPQSQLILDSAGNLYGTTVSGGRYNLGTVFELSFNGSTWSETVLWDFGNVTGDGSGPLRGVTIDPSGNLYGTTSAGGASGKGTVFELSPVGGGLWNETILLSFAGVSDGAAPRGGVLRDPAGNLFGTAQQGGTYNSGTAFELSPPAVGGNPWTEKVLWAFGSGTDGRGPGAELISDSSGNLYGTTWDGGTYDCHCPNNFGGTIFKLTPPASPSVKWTEAVIWSLGGSSSTGSGKNKVTVVDGQLPWASSLLLGSSGNLYGTAMKGGAHGYGIAFKLTPPSAGSTWTETILWAFSGGLDGKSPQTGLTRIDTSSALYGSTNNGGSNQDGTVFKITP